jgi:2-C-methyl-D-erythritol 4-phosphate cytidylyltransferase
MARSACAEKIADFHYNSHMSESFYALVPAAGSGSRMGHELPKQYIPLAGQPMIYHALARLCAHPEISTVFVVLAADDTHWHQYDWSELGDKLQTLFCGGKTRAESVLNGLLASELEPGDWVLVHDAARPCLTVADIEQLLQVTEEESVGALLATPVADTLKRAAPDGRVLQTVPRDALWRAQTPQMFRLSLLQGALQDSLAQGRVVTDEASAVEALGLMPRLVRGSTHNLKITLPEDLALAAQILAARTEAGS